MKLLVIVCLISLQLPLVHAQKNGPYNLSSPDKQITFTLTTGDALSWSVKHGEDIIIAPSNMGITLVSGEVLGKNVKVIAAKTTAINTTFNTPVYKKKTVTDHYNQLQLECKGGYSIEVRAYNDGVAYRFVLAKKDSITIQAEQADFNFEKDYTCLVPYVRDFRGKEQYIQSYEALYTKAALSKVYKDTLGFLPVLVEAGTKKAVILEAGLTNYPGMFVTPNGSSGKGFSGKFAAYPLEEMQGGYEMMNTMVNKRANYIAKVKGDFAFPWRAVVISSNDAELANNDMVQKLSAPSQIKDASWIKPGKVAWDWWNDWNITHVDFKPGITTETYKYYIDFAAANKLEYIIMDWGWSSKTDLLTVSDKINLAELIAYGNQKNVGIILWASWYAVNKQVKEVCQKYSAMGIKGFKIDFIDRDDQKAVASLTTIAETAAACKLLVDYHGVYKPVGLQRTWPNVLNFEGVKGMENVKWTPNDDMPGYEVTIPFIRMMAGPMDYTPGAMRNAAKEAFKFNNSLPEGQGTRCHQLAMYTIFEAPLQMLCDNPTVYTKEQECTNFIDSVPTVFDETIALGGKVGSYVAIARKKNETWYVGAMTNWDARDIVIDCSFLGTGTFDAVIFKDGINADRDATDYKTETIRIKSADKIAVHMEKGGGWSARITKAR